MNSGGIGLGLNIAKQIVEHAGGKIYAKSDGIDQGSVFCFSMLMPVGTDAQDDEEFQIIKRKTEQLLSSLQNPNSKK